MKAKEEFAENHLHALEPRWFAVYTRFQREKIILRRLERKGVQAYLPLREMTREYTRKKRVVQLPLISGYIFVRITQKEYVSVLETKDVVHFVQFSRNLIAIPDQEIILLKRVTGEDLDVEAEPGCLTIGDEVEIARGGLAGVRGILVSNKRKNFVIELRNIGYALRMQVQKEDLIPAEAAV